MVLRPVLTTNLLTTNSSTPSAGPVTIDCKRFSRPAAQDSMFHPIFATMGRSVTDASHSCGLAYSRHCSVLRFFTRPMCQGSNPVRPGCTALRHQAASSIQVSGERRRPRARISLGHSKGYPRSRTVACKHRNRAWPQVRPARSRRCKARRPERLRSNSALLRSSPSPKKETNFRNSSLHPQGASCRSSDVIFSKTYPQLLHRWRTSQSRQNM